MKSKKKISKKEGYKKGKAILEALNKETNEIKQSSYVIYDNIIEFPKPVAFTIKRLKELIKQAEKYKGKGFLIGLQIEIPMDKIPKELRIYKGKRKIMKSKTKEVK